MKDKYKRSTPTVKEKARRKAYIAKKKAGRKSAPRRGRGIAHQMISQPAQGGETSSACTLKAYKHTAITRAICNVGTKQRWLSNYTTSLQTSQGKQDVRSFSANNRALLKVFADQYQGAIPNGATPGPQVARYVLEHVRYNHAIMNDCSAPVQIKIYDIELRRDLNTAMNYSSPTGSNYLWTGAEGAWDAGLQAAQGFVSGASPNQRFIYGAVPTESAVFNAYFRIAKQTTVNLAVGGLHRHVYNRQYNRLLDASVYGNTYANGFQGLTHWQMVVLVPPPGSLVAGSGATINTTVPAVKVNIVSDMEVNYTFGASYAQTLSVNDNMPLADLDQTVDVFNATIPLNAPVLTG